MTAPTSHLGPHLKTISSPNAAGFLWKFLLALWLLVAAVHFMVAVYLPGKAGSDGRANISGGTFAARDATTQPVQVKYKGNPVTMQLGQLFGVLHLCFLGLTGGAFWIARRNPTVKTEVHEHGVVVRGPGGREESAAFADIEHAMTFYPRGLMVVGLNSPTALPTAGWLVITPATLADRVEGLYTQARLPKVLAQLQSGAAVDFIETSPSMMKEAFRTSLRDLFPHNPQTLRLQGGTLTRQGVTVNLREARVEQHEHVLTLSAPSGAAQRIDLRQVSNPNILLAALAQQIKQADGRQEDGRT